MATWSQKLNDWLVPSALGCVVYFSQAIASEVKSIRIDVAIAVTQMRDLERRVEIIESHTGDKNGLAYPLAPASAVPHSNRR